jgi:hypothetical protein
MELAELRQILYEELFHAYLPFWEKHGIDHENGGVICSLDYDGTRVKSEKSLWFQGRALWVYSFLYNHFGQDPRWLEVARKTKEFLLKYARQEDGWWAEVLSQEGQVLRFFSGDTEGMYFVAEGLQEYSAATGDGPSHEAAVSLLKKLFRYFNSPDFRYRGADFQYLWTSKRAVRLQGLWFLNLNIATQILKRWTDPPAPGQGSGHGDEVLLRDKVESKTDPEARLYKKAKADKSVPSYRGHALMENRNGLVVAAQASCSSTAAEREAALEMLDEVVKPPVQGAHQAEVTLGADTQYQDEKFIAALRERGVAPHVSEYTKGAASLGKNALNEQERADPRRSISQRKRKLIERVFGWAKLDRPLQQIKLRGLKRVDWFYRLVVTAYNLMRMGKLIPIPGQVG